ncbi:NmrA domain-containing protein [Trichoderma simmonsii]|uniref:NmrA domain-containing protein n=1 Tax=Trichoderma simmonsii TaxID=1491479 RepID=A0A8G0L3Q0_9HYPO|nr:NmrA domain-containing protein [Trichoderma simmonsii]
MSFKNIAVIGANGNLGKGILPLLLESGLKITAVTRQISESTFPQTGEVRRTDYSFGSLKSAFHGQDAVLCLVSVADVRAEIAMVDAAAAAGVQWFIPSEFGHDTANPCVVEVLPLIPGERFFFDFGLTFDLLGFDLHQKTAAIWDDGNNRSSMSTFKTIAQAIIQIFTDPTSREEAKNQYIRIATATTTQNEILQALERVSGTKFQVTRIETAEGKRLGDQHLASGDNDLAGFFLLLKYVALGKNEFLDWENRPGPHRLAIKAQQESVLDIVGRMYPKITGEVERGEL